LAKGIKGWAWWRELEVEPPLPREEEEEEEEDDIDAVELKMNLCSLESTFKTTGDRDDDRPVFFFFAEVEAVWTTPERCSICVTAFSSYLGTKLKNCSMDTKRRNERSEQNDKRRRGKKGERRSQKKENSRCCERRAE
jgi:hypothetical protein